MVSGVGMRALRGFVSGALSTASLITVANVSTWTELSSIVAALLLSVTIGGINGLLLGADKLVRWEE